MKPSLLPSLLGGALLLALASSCAAGKADARPAPKSEAEAVLLKGEDAMKDKNYEEARAFFDQVTARYPFLDVARTAELRIADISYEKEEFPEARDKYQQFVKLHPTHPEVDYAAFRAAMTNYQEIPKDFFILPPSYEKDQTPVKNALRAMEDFIRQYPKSKYLAEAEKTHTEVRRRLCQHELYVADFYAKRGKWQAVVSRLNTLVQTYPGAGYDEQALFGVYEAYLKLRDSGRAQETLRRIITALPGTKAAQRAQKLLQG
ncbi:MAG TPA: outer membrane protein assembly factor BamD [Myxococcales bacterium]|nr:outer membrane protein assembly factor BamD [Myxococcales bacterium]